MEAHPGEVRNTATWQVRTSDSSVVFVQPVGPLGWAGSHFLQMAPGVSKAHFEAPATDPKDYWILFSVCDNSSGAYSCRKWLWWLLKWVLKFSFGGSFSLPLFKIATSSLTPSLHPHPLTRGSTRAHTHAQGRGSSPSNLKLWHWFAPSALGSPWQ